MRIRDGFVLREVAGQFVVIATGDASKDFHGMIKLNGTGKDLWQGLCEGASEDHLVQQLVKTYGVSAEQAAADVDNFVTRVREAGLLTS